jgi:hypothetical protein
MEMKRNTVDNRIKNAVIAVAHSTLWLVWHRCFPPSVFLYNFYTRSMFTGFLKGARSRNRRFFADSQCGSARQSRVAAIIGAPERVLR